MKPINIKDIAKLAGVGVSTVSRVINNHPDVKEETRNHVLSTIEKYNYIPNNSARNLKRLDPNHIGILVKGVFNPFFARMVEIIEKKLSEKKYTVVVHYHTDETPDIEVAYEFVMEKKLKGLMILGGDFDLLTNEMIEKLRVPLVFSSTELPASLDQTKFSSVLIDNEKAVFKAVSELCAMGHKKIGLISTGEGDQSVGAKRTLGYIKALKSNKLPKVDEFFEVGDYSFEKGYEAMKRLLKKAQGMTAVFAISDIMAIGACKAIMESGLKIPEDLSVMGFDNIDYAAYYNPGLTTVHQPIDEMASESARMMLRHLSEEELVHEHFIFDTTIIHRQTCSLRG